MSPWGDGGLRPPFSLGAGTPAWVSLPSIAGQVYATNVPQARLPNAATVQKKNAWFPTCTLRALVGGCGWRQPGLRRLAPFHPDALKHGGRTRLMPHIAALGTEPMDETELALLFFPLPLRWSLRELSGSGEGGGNQFDPYPG